MVGLLFVTFSYIFSLICELFFVLIRKMGSLHSLPEVFVFKFVRLTVQNLEIIYLQNIKLRKIAKIYISEAATDKLFLLEIIIWIYILSKYLVIFMCFSTR